MAHEVLDQQAVFLGVSSSGSGIAWRRSRVLAADGAAQGVEHDLLVLGRFLVEPRAA